MTTGGGNPVAGDHLGKDGPLLELIEHIYDAALDPSAWPVFLNKLVAALDAQGAAIRVYDEENTAMGYLASVGYEEKYLAQFREHYINQDPFFPAMKDWRAGTLALGQDIIHYPDWMNTEFFYDYVRPQGVFHTLGGIVFREGSRAGMLVVPRNRDAGAYDERALQLVNALAPHLERSLRIQSRLIDLSANVNSVEMVLDQLAVGVVLLDELGLAWFVNQRAEGIVSTHPMLKLTAARFCTPYPTLTETLQTLVEEAVRTGKGHGLHPGGSLVLDGDEISGPLHLLIAPMPMGSGELLLGGRRACAAVFIGSPHAQQGMAADVVAALFGLTPAEARLVLLLVAGHTLSQIAERLCISIHTARTQLKRIFSKTTTHSQSELVATVLASPAAAVMQKEDI